MTENSEFFTAIRSNDLDAVAELLDMHPSLANARIRGDATLLNEQVWENRQKVDMQPDDERDSTALHYTAFHGNVDLARLLIEHGADVNALAYENNHEWTTPVVLAAWEGGIDVLRLLLENGANPNSKSSNGVTPLSTATRHKKQERVDLLRQHGATA